MPDRKDCVVITDVTLREYGQNIPEGFLHIFNPEIRVEITSRLIDAGFKNVEILSCIHPKIAPAMNQEALKKIASELGKIQGVNLITLVPNKAGYRNFLENGFGPDCYDHTMSIFFSAVEAHNLANLGRPIKATIEDYRSILEDASSRGIRTIAYISAAFGYMDPVSGQTLQANLDEINQYMDLLLNMGVKTVTLTDLQGVADEKETRRILETILSKRKGKQIDKLGYHPHHISGEKAIANSVVVYLLGLRRFDSSLGGTGGCITGAPGNQPTEGLFRHFTATGIETGLNGDRISSLANMIQTELYTKISLGSARNRS
ncbi:MAG: hypothetical protein ABIG67_03340 [Pseudomonadota bacterium]